MSRFYRLILLYALLLAPRANAAAPPNRKPESANQAAKARYTIRLKADKTVLGMGYTLLLTASVVDSSRKPAPGLELWPYVDGKRWGAQEFTDRQGRAVFPLPLPNPGIAHIQVMVAPSQFKPTADWIWANVTRDSQTVYFRKTFTLPKVPQSAQLHITCDDEFHAFLNGQEIGAGGDFHNVRVLRALQPYLHVGENVLSVEGKNGTGPAGLLAALSVSSDAFDSPAPRAGTETAPRNPRRPLPDALADYIVAQTDRSWEFYAEKPADWPQPAAKGVSAVEIAPVGGGPWGAAIVGWPGLSPRKDFPVGLPMPRYGRTIRVGQGANPRIEVDSRVVVSNVFDVRVERRPIHALVVDPMHRVGMEWEPWFTPLNARWDTAESVPILGDYDSFNADVIRQHALWMTEAGVDFLLVDWSNNLWDRKHWSERAPGIDELIRGTTQMLDAYAQMRREGILTPQVTLLLGLDNGPQTTTTALNEEMQWVYEHYVQNPRYQGLWLMVEGKPLIVPFNGGGPAIRRGQPPLDESQFTVRWMASQLQGNHLDRQGYWSWMDGVLHPIPTMRDGKAEALTVTPAFFGAGGWTYPQARGRLGGWTYLESFRTALEMRPRFLIINQWNEFAGQPDGGGYGPKKDQFVDSYTTELSDDIEPTALATRASRPGGGWGYYYLNLTRALIYLYRRQADDSVILAVRAPARHAVVSGPTLAVRWTELGKPVRSFTLLIDGRVRKENLRGNSCTLDIHDLAPGRHAFMLRADRATTNFPLSETEEDKPLAFPIPAAVEYTIVVSKPRQK